MTDVAVRSTSFGTASSATSVSASEPSGAAVGDLLVAFALSNNSVTISDNNGSTAFTTDTSVQETTNGITGATFYRWKQSGDPTTLSFSQSGAASRMGLVIFCFSNPHASTALDVTSVTSTSSSLVSSFTPTGLTTSTDKAIHVPFAGQDGAASSTSPISAWAYANNNVQSAATTTGGELAMGSSLVITPAGATSSSSYTSNRSDGWVGISVAVKNNAGGGAVVTASARMMLGMGM